jgi:hypothetical protein
MHQSGNIACQKWPKIAKCCTSEPLYWLNQVTTILAVPTRILLNEIKKDEKNKKMRRIKLKKNKIYLSLPIQFKVP